jgi:hypothetical protein
MPRLQLVEANTLTTIHYYKMPIRSYSPNYCYLLLKTNLYDNKLGNLIKTPSGTYILIPLALGARFRALGDGGRHTSTHLAQLAS